MSRFAYLRRERTVTGAEYGPMTARRTLAQALADHRERLRLRGADVASPIGWSPSRLSRIESGHHPIQVQDVLLLATSYELDPAERERLVGLARANLREGWWEAFKGDLGKDHSRFIALEAEAVTESVVETMMFPGLLQTEDYARAVIAGGPAELTADQVEQRVKARMARRDVLTRGEEPLRLNVVLDEAALRRRVGGEEVMRGQVQHLLELMELPRVTVQVLPFDAGAHPAMEGSFTVLDFPASVPPAAYVETPAGETWIEQPEQVERFAIAHARLTGMALSPADTIALLADMAGE